MDRITDTPRLAAFVFALLAITFAAPAVGAQTPIEIDGVVVTATPTPQELATLGNHVTLIDGDELAARGITRLTQVLREIPGLTVARNGSFGAATSVFFRGGESDYTLVMIDGVQMNQPGGAFDFSGLTTENIERIEIVRGPSSALYGSDAVAGVIHIITRNGAGPTRAEAGVRTGSFGRLDATVEVAGGNPGGSYAVSLARYRTDGILAFNNRNLNTVLSGKGRVRLDDRTVATLSARVGDRQYNFPTDFSGNVVDRNQFTFQDETNVSLALDREFGERITVRALATTYAVDGGTDDAPDSPADTLGFFGSQSLDAFRRRSLDLRGSFEFDGGALTLGGEVEEQRVRSFNESLSQYGPSTGRSSNERDNRAGYAHLTTSLGPISANGGVRLEDNERYGGFTTWQLGASWSPVPGTRIRGVTGKAIKEPTFFETFADGFARGNPDLDPERSFSWELGIEQEALDGDLRLQATFFDQSFTDLIQYTGTPPTPNGPNYFNVAEAESRGIELGAHARLGAVRIFADWTILDTEVVDAGFQSGSSATFVEGEALLRRPENTGRLGFEAEVGSRVRVDAVVRRTGERSDRNFAAFPAEPIALEAYTLLDAGLRAVVIEATADRPGVELTLRGENLADVEYQEVFGFEAPGRGLYLGGRVSWGAR